jgi:mono/diheme cytochrome c family protein
VNRRALVGLLAAASTACGDAARDPETGGLTADAVRYLDDPAAGPAALEAALVNPANGYARDRRAHYRVGDWLDLPEWRPRVYPARPGETRPGDTPLAAPEADPPRETEAFRALGEALFFDYPVQFVPGLSAALADPARFGLGVTDGRVDGLVWVDTPGGPALALTCAACHSRPTDAGRVAGLGNPEFDLARVVGSAWPPGMADVTTDGREDPMSFPDLRAVRFQHTLNRAATMRNGLLPLAARAETQIIASLGAVARPPRTYALALAVYLFDLGEALPLPETTGNGRAVFDAACAACHAGEGLVGEPVAIARIGADPYLAESPERRTGYWQVPSLRGVSDRERLFAGGEVEGLDALLDPARAWPGHRFGLDLDPGDRAALLEFLRSF